MPSQTVADSMRLRTAGKTRLKLSYYFQVVSGQEKPTANADARRQQDKPRTDCAVPSVHVWSRRSEARVKQRGAQRPSSYNAALKSQDRALTALHVGGGIAEIRDRRPDGRSGGGIADLRVSHGRVTG